MKKFTNKKILFNLFIILFISFILFIPSISYAKTENKIDIGEEISGTSLDTEFQYYKFTLKSKMKVKISITVEEKIVDDSDYFYFPEDNQISFDLYDDNFKNYIKDWKINAGETKTKTVTLGAGTYEIGVFGYIDDLNYSFSTKDVSAYTTKISMNNKLSLLKGDSKTLTVKSKESGKLVGEVKWTTSNKKVATVDPSGKVKGIKEGTCVISAKTNNSNTVKCNITIKARPQLYITEASFDIDFLGGVEPYITFQNNFGKTIKYIYFNTYYYNTVDDPAYCEIQNTNYQRLQITGPIKNGVTDSYYWDAVIYNNSTGKMYIKSAEIKFMDGTTKTISIKKSFK